MIFILFAVVVLMLHVCCDDLIAFDNSVFDAWMIYSQTYNNISLTDDTQYMIIQDRQLFFRSYNISDYNNITLKYDIELPLYMLINDSISIVSIVYRCDNFELFMGKMYHSNSVNQTVYISENINIDCNGDILYVYIYNYSPNIAFPNDVVILDNIGLYGFKDVTHTTNIVRSKLILYNNRFDINGVYCFDEYCKYIPKHEKYTIIIDNKNNDRWDSLGYDIMYSHNYSLIIDLFGPMHCDTVILNGSDNIELIRDIPLIKPFTKCDYITSIRLIFYALSDIYIANIYIFGDNLTINTNVEPSIKTTPMHVQVYRLYMNSFLIMISVLILFICITSILVIVFYYEYKNKLQNKEINDLNQEISKHKIKTNIISDNLGEKDHVMSDQERDINGQNDDDLQDIISPFGIDSTELYQLRAIKQLSIYVDDD